MTCSGAISCLWQKERYARQYRCWPPPEFLRTLPVSDFFLKKKRRGGETGWRGKKVKKKEQGEKVKIGKSKKREGRGKKGNEKKKQKVCQRDRQADVLVLGTTACWMSRSSFVVFFLSRGGPSPAIMQAIDTLLGYIAKTFEYCAFLYVFQCEIAMPGVGHPLAAIIKRTFLAVPSWLCRLDDLRAVCSFFGGNSHQKL